MAAPTAGPLATVPVSTRFDLVAPAVEAALKALAGLADIGVVEIDPALSDTAAFTAAYQVPPELSANCVVVAGKRDGTERIAACMVPATTRADVNGVVRKRLDVRKASFLPMDRAVGETGMEYGGITPVGLPGWPVLVDARVAGLPVAVIGSGLRRSKLVLPGAALAALPGAEVVDRLALPIA
jgi:prolyl-tRNA editing enzyme YbaK/EbsC (Cys-tRNA(Pro) deacylase)